MKISILGAAVYDEIITHLGERRESYGGITYNVAALSSIVAEGTVISPISNVGADHFENVRDLMASHRGVDVSDLERVDGKLTHAKLTYKSASWRDEIVTNLMAPLTAERALAASDSDAILVNFVNGTEVELETLAALREKTTSFFHLDVHSKVWEWSPDGSRSKAPFADWREWFGLLDAVQMNEFECAMVIGREVKEEPDFVAAAVEMLDAGPKIVLVTLGPQGSVMAYRDNSTVYTSACPAAQVDNVVDTTGCGDSFSAGFIWNYLQSKSPVAANAAANIVGGINCTTSGTGQLDEARNALGQIPRWFPELAEKLDAGWPGDKVTA